jgi:nicotinamide-nucleotide amidase
MNAEILMIGTELLLGQIVDTNANLLARMLVENGINLYQKTTVGDNHGRIVAALRGALERSDVVLCSGGLGPTEDDITRECVAEVFGVEVAYRPELYENILERFRPLRIEVPENNKRQATLPIGAQHIDNPRGTAPGVIMEGPQGIVICMPGVPHELEGMMRDSVIPWLRRRFGITGVLHYKSLKVAAVGESRVDALLGGLVANSSNPTVGLLASPEATRIRIAARAETMEEAQELIARMEATIHERLPGLVFGSDRDQIESAVDRLLAERGWKLYLTEQATGGLIAQKLLAAGSRNFAGGTVLPIDPASQDEISSEKVLALCKEHLLPSADSCSLSVLYDTAHRRSVAAFVSPDGEWTWELGDYAKGQRNQLRATVYCLECVRRALLGIETSI